VARPPARHAAWTRAAAPGQGAIIEPSPSPARIEHVPAIDGLRGVALLGVLAFHANGALRGGYLGVDLFFVLSGYLITRLLLAEHGATGRVALWSFWVRRARRLFPALLALMPAIGLYAHFIATPTELAGIRADAVATLAYVANWHAILSQRSYWELFLAPSPLEHTWSLAIEEQFYLVWPLIVVVVLRRFGARGLFVVALSLAVLSMLAMAALFDPARTMRVYYGTDTRAAAILAGAAFACVRPSAPLTGGVTSRLLDVSGVFALAGLAWVWSSIDGRDFLLYRGGFWLAEALSLVLLACAIAPRQGVVARLLSFAPLRALGLVSYGAYLWHWPVNLVLTAERCHVHGLALHALRAAVTLGIAALSYRFLEQPIRRRGLPFGAPRVVVPLAFATACLVVMIGAWPRPPSRIATTPSPALTSKVPAAPVPVRLRVRVLGDSTGNALGWMLKSVAAPDIEVELRAKDGLNLIFADHIRWNAKDDGVDVTLVGVGGAFLYGIHVRGKWTLACHTRWNSLFEEGLDLHLADLANSKSELWLATAPYPLGPYDDQARRTQLDCINRSIRKIALKHPRFRLLDLAEMVCPKGECTREVNGLPLRADGVHFNIAAAADLGRRVLGELDPVGDRAARTPASVAIQP
jgi:peptidoglycan/LPS O-acetylase OafA/YrhL